MAQKFTQFQLTPQEVKKAVQFIDKEWKNLERYNPHDRATLIGLPHPYIIPSGRSDIKFQFQEQYYWDTYFIMQAFLGTEHHQLAVDMVENLMYMMERFGVIPNGSRFYLTGRSQAPLLSSMILQIYAFDKNKKWLAESMTVAKEEYRKVWMSQDHPNWRHVFKGLSRYYHIDVMHELAETESGWDLSPRFHREAMNYIPVDLNALLFKYEMDFAESAIILGDHEEAKDWIDRAILRRNTVEEYMWNEQEGFYYDYNYVTGKQTDIASLAGFYPLWAGMVSDKKAHRLVEKLKLFEEIGGLTCTEKVPAAIDAQPLQWCHPNGWAPLHWLVVSGLLRYGYQDEAKRIMEKWLKTNLFQFMRDGIFYEKYNVVDPEKKAKEGLYPMQTGFGWTNAIFERFANDYFLKENFEYFTIPLLAHSYNSFCLI